MAVIPIDPKEVIIHKDDNGNEFHFRYLTGKHRAMFQKAQSAMTELSQPYFERAKKSLKNGAKIHEIAQRAIELAKKAGAITPEIEDKQSADIIDVMLCNWKGKGFPKITETNPPSTFLTQVQLAEVMEMASQYIEQVLGLTEEDRKN